MALVSTSILVVNKLPQIGAPKVYIPRLSSSFFLPFPMRLQDRQMGLTNSFQISASALDPKACEILYAFFKSGVSFSHSTQDIPKVSRAGLQVQMFRGLVFPVQEPQVKEPNVGAQTIHSLRRASVIIFQLVGCPSRGIGLTIL